MSSNLRFASIETPGPGSAWVRLSDDERVALVAEALAKHMPEADKQLDVITALEDGQVIVHLLQTLSPGDRGTLLLDVEAMLKEVVDEGLVVWLEALGDRNSLRNLRGIEVKAS